ncbi:MAG: TIGR01777 family oxidoreductase [Bacteroidetes bacterium]|nr:TIGR01777 family oxidoreductase [Bacteroidota bacterium]
MRILISGSTGFLGNALVELLQQGGHTVVRLVRDSHHAGLLWDPYARSIDRSRLHGFDAVINLSGESISGRWTASKKREILRSRIETGNFLVELISEMKQKPSVYLSASAIGYYGDRSDEVLTESSAPGSDFLADVCKQWEAVSKPLETQGLRVIRMRTGLVLSPKGGALQQLLLPFKLGAGGPVGSGRQWWSWIDFDDQIRAYEFALTNEKISGAVNGTAPNPVTNKEFVKALGKALSRPSFMPLPSFAVKLLLGEMGEGLLLGSQRVEPKALVNSGFEFGQTEIEKCFRKLL